MKTILTLFFSLCFVSSFAQTNYVAGTYINLKGDTINSFIDDQNWRKNPEFILVKQDLNSESSQKLTVADIKSFSLSTGDVYEAHAVVLDKSPVNLSDIKLDAKPNLVNDTVFLRYLIKGKLSLFTYRDTETKEHFFVKEAGANPVELILRTEKIEHKGEEVFQKVESYKGVLALYLSQCESLSSNHLQFRASTFINFVSEYNKCTTGVRNELKAVDKPSNLVFGLTAGVAFNTLSFSGEKIESLHNQSYSSITRTFGVNLDYVLPRSHGKYAILTEVMFKKIGGSGTHEHRVSDENYAIYHNSFNVSQVGVNTLIRYRLSNNGLKPFVTFGMANNFVISDDSKQKIDKKYYGVRNENFDKPIKSVRPHEQGFLLGTGIGYNNFTAEVRGELGNGISSYTLLKSVKKSVSLLISYRFNKK